METKKLTEKQAFKAMITFLDKYYHRLDKPDVLGSLLGDLRLLDDEMPLDPAAWHDWLEAVNETTRV